MKTGTKMNFSVSVQAKVVCKKIKSRLPVNKYGTIDMGEWVISLAIFIELCYTLHSSAKVKFFRPKLTCSGNPTLWTFLLCMLLMLRPPSSIFAINTYQLCAIQYPNEGITSQLSGYDNTLFFKATWSIKGLQRSISQRKVSISYLLIINHTIYRQFPSCNAMLGTLLKKYTFS